MPINGPGRVPTEGLLQIAKPVNRLRSLRRDQTASACWSTGAAGPKA